jgi:hypothetical protein
VHWGFAPVVFFFLRAGAPELARGRRGAPGALQARWSHCGSVVNITFTCSNPILGEDSGCIVIWTSCSSRLV